MKKSILITVATILVMTLCACTSSDDESSSSQYDMPEAGESFSEYVQREDPELYAYMEGRYDYATGN